MNAVTRRDLLNGSLSLQRLDRDFGFQLGTELSVLSHVCLLRQLKSTLGPCPNFGEYLILSCYAGKVISCVAFSIANEKKPIAELNFEIQYGKTVFPNSILDFRTGKLNSRLTFSIPV